MTYGEYFFIDYGLPLLGIIVTTISQIIISINYNRYKKEGTRNKFTGYETARKILDNNGLSNVKINRVSGNLTDHYNPQNKIINLSADIYDGNSVSSVSVAAHECGHAIQDKEGYLFLRFRSALVPFVNFSSKIGYLVVFIGLIFNALKLARFGIILLLAILLFQLVTLPVEFNASNRAKKQLTRLNITTEEEKNGTKKVLMAAALTYVASLLSTLLQILRLALIVANRSDD